MAVFLGIRKPPIEDAFLDSSGKLRTDINAISFSRYAQYMRQWRKYFPLSQFLIIDTQDLIDNPLDVTTQVEQFLGLEHKITEDNFVFGENKGFYCFRKSLNATKVCMNRKKGRDHPDLNPELERKLREYFAPFNREFYDMVGRNFSWLE